MRHKKLIRYLMILSIIIIIFSIVGIILENISFEQENTKKKEDSKEVQVFRHNILDYNNGIATVEGGKQFKVVGEAKNQIILKKVSDVYINTSSNEIIKIEFKEESAY